MSEETMVQVQNLSSNYVSFIDDNNGLKVRIKFNPDEVKKLPADMLRRLNFSYGGSVLLREYLSVKDSALAAEFGVPKDQVEYNWTRADVDNCLLNGSLDQLADALDFAPEAIVDLIVARTIQMRLNNVQKRELISKATGKDINTMIENLDKINEDAPESEAPKQRRVAANTEQSTGRRVQQESSTAEK